MAPTIRPLNSAVETEPPAGVLSMDGGPRHSFVVVSPGDHNGMHLREGDVLVVGGRARPGDCVVLLARGLGRPRLGSVSHAGLLGDAGELCSSARWVSAGRVLEVVYAPPRPLESRWEEGGQLTLTWAA